MQNNVRHGYLFQPIDYNETTIDGIVSKKKLSDIQTTFPELKMTECTQGVVISHHTYSPNDLDNEEFMANILGYPCTIPDKELRCTYDICITLDSGPTFPIITFISEQVEQKSQIDEYSYSLAMRIEHALKQIPNPYKDRVQHVSVSKTYNCPTDYYIGRLVNWRGPFSENDKCEIDNFLYNIGFDRLKNYVYDKFDYTNPVHRGMLAAILTYSKYPTIEPFFPLQTHPKQRPLVEKQIESWETLLLDVFNGRIE